MKISDILLGVLVVVIWGSNFSVIEVGLHELDPFMLTALRFTFSALPLMLFIKRPAQVPLAALAGYGILFGVGLWWVVNVAMYKGMSPGLSSLVLQFSAFFTILLSSLLLGERVHRWQWLGMAVSVSGLCMIIHGMRQSSTLIGVALVLLAALGWSTCNLIVKKARPVDMLAFVVWSSAFSAPALFVLCYVTQGARPFLELPGHLGAAVVFSVFFQAYVTTVFGYRVWNTLMKKYPAALVAPLSLLVPVSGLLTSYLVFDEHLSPWMWTAVAVVLSGIGLFVNAGRLWAKVQPT